VAIGPGLTRPDRGRGLGRKTAARGDNAAGVVRAAGQSVFPSLSTSESTLRPSVPVSPTLTRSHAVRPPRTLKETRMNPLYAKLLDRVRCPHGRVSGPVHCPECIRECELELLEEAMTDDG
jgi:hypothetical protein